MMIHLLWKFWTAYILTLFMREKQTSTLFQSIAIQGSLAGFHVLSKRIHRIFQI